MADCFLFESHYDDPEHGFAVGQNKMPCIVANFPAQADVSTAEPASIRPIS